MPVSLSGSGAAMRLVQYQACNDQSSLSQSAPPRHDFIAISTICQKGRKGAGVKGVGVANCRIFRSAVPSVVVWSILLVSLSGVKKSYDNL